MNKWIFLAAVLFCSSGHAQVVKCKDVNGKITYSDSACPANFSGSSVNLSGGNVTEDQVRQAREVYRRDAAQVQRIENENAAKIAQQRQNQQASRYVDGGSSPTNDSNNRDACVQKIEGTSGLSARQKAGLIASCHGSGVTSNVAKSSVDSCVAKIERISGLSARQKATALAQCHGASVGTEGGSVNMPVTPQPAVITNCDNGGCWDNMGGRYNKAAGGNYFRGDGKFCQQVGNQMQCR